MRIHAAVRLVVSLVSELVCAVEETTFVGQIRGMLALERDPGVAVFFCNGKKWYSVWIFYPASPGGAAVVHVQCGP